MRGTNILATFFDWNREVIEAAETPFAKLAIFILPVLAPLVPAFMTSLHMFKLLQELFTFIYAVEISATMSIIIGITLELLGYVGAITFIRSLFQYVKHSKDEILLPVILNGAAYLFYIVAMWLINYQLGRYFGTASIINTIFGLLSFITVPTGLLAANHLSQRADDEYEEKLRREDRDYKLERLRIKTGYTGASTKDEKKDKKTKSASWYREKMWQFMDTYYKQKNEPPRVVDIVKHFKLDYDRSKGFVSGERKKWLRSRNIPERQ